MKASVIHTSLTGCRGVLAYFPTDLEGRSRIDAVPRAAASLPRRDPCHRGPLRSHAATRFCGRDSFAGTWRSRREDGSNILGREVKEKYGEVTFAGGVMMVYIRPGITVPLEQNIIRLNECYKQADKKLVLFFWLYRAPVDYHQ